MVTNPEERRGGMRERTAARLAWVMLGCIALVAAALLAIDVGAGLGIDPFALVMLSFPVVGALVAARQPGNAVGWVMLAVGVVAVLGDLPVGYAQYALDIRPGSLPRPDFALALGAPMWVPLIGLMGTFVILLFPDGRLPSRRWRPWAWFCALGMILSFIGILLTPDSFTDVGYPGIRNPLGIVALPEAALVIIFSIPIGILGCAAALIQRFRRSHGQDRLQLKWLAAGAGATATVYLAAMVATLTLDAPWDGRGPLWLTTLQDVAAFSFVLIPVAVGIAILKYRLYDIDLIINRTLVYGALTATLTAAYLLAVTILQGLLSPVAGRSQLAVAGSTLAVAALFRPGRARIQGFIDRRFYRRKYDAARTLETFSASLRDVVDLDALTGELAVLIGDVMQPAHVSVWLREGCDAAGAGATPSASLIPPPRDGAARGHLPPRHRPIIGGGGPGG